MKCVAFLTVFLLISSAEMSTGYRTERGNNVNITHDSFKSSFLLSSIEKKNDSVNQFTLEEFVDFTQVAEFQDYMSLGVDVFGHIYDNLLVVYRDFLGGSKGADYVIEKNKITFLNVTMLSTFLKSYNKHITHLSFMFSSDVNNAALFDSLRVNCAATLRRLEMQFNRERDFDLFNGLSFPNVHELTFKFCEIGNQTIDLQQVFPNVQRLTIDYTEYTSWFDKLLTSPQLTNLEVRIGPKWYFPEEAVIKILENNRRIKNFGIYNATPSLLRHINFHHSQIELTLGHVSEEFKGVNDICMQNITKFSFNGIVHFRVPITFSKLKELQWHSKPMPLDDGLLDFIEKHKGTIESLQIDGTRLNETHFEKMQQMKELKKIILNYEGELEATAKINGLIKLVRANPRLVMIRFTGADSKQNERLFEDFKAAGLKGWVNSFELHSRDKGDIDLVRLQIFRY